MMNVGAVVVVRVVAGSARALPLSFELKLDAEETAGTADEAGVLELEAFEVVEGPGATADFVFDDAGADPSKVTSTFAFLA